MNRTLIAFAAAAIGLSLTGAAHASQYKALHDFCRQTNCVDGAAPFSAPVSDGAGHYFGTTVTGGGHGGGTVYEMSFDGGRWVHQRIHRFCTKSNCADGSAPFGRLIVDASGNLYGLATSGGKHGKGAVYELIPHEGDWKYKLLYSFCAQASCADGSSPQYGGLSYQGAASGAAYDGISPLYGTVELGGANGGGAVFALTRADRGWDYSVIFDFCAFDQCDSGTGPTASVLVDGQGNLFGTTLDGGAHEDGTVFELSRNGAGWSETVLYNFCAEANCADGSFPYAPLIMDGAGDLYGTTSGGGAHNSGSVFKLHPDGAASQITTLHSFCSDGSCSDGSIPYAGLTMDAHGRLFGAAIQGGSQSFGVLFMLSGRHLTKFSTVVDFGSAGAPGGQPYSAPALDASGMLFGTAWTGGSGNSGVVYRFKP